VPGVNEIVKKSEARPDVHRDLPTLRDIKDTDIFSKTKNKELWREVGAGFKPAPTKNMALLA
jgi:hypothetical protein